MGYKTPNTLKAQAILKADLLEFLELEAISEGWGIPGIPGKPSELRASSVKHV